jgi:hypothetical protein
VPDDTALPRVGVSGLFGTRRAIDEMLSLCGGLIFEGAIAATEATQLAQWVRDHREIADMWPASVVARRLGRIFVNGMVTSEERDALRELLERVSGAEPITASEAEWGRYLELDDPPPQIVIAGKRFCFAGRFFFGTRRACKAAVIDRGGAAFDRVRQDLDFVVVGLFGSPVSFDATAASEIREAMNYRAMGLGPAIVSEKQWARELGDL